jgi:hypothetical protein
VPTTRAALVHANQPGKATLVQAQAFSQLKDAAADGRHVYGHCLHFLPCANAPMHFA